MPDFNYDYDVSWILELEAEYEKAHGRAPICLSRWDTSDALSYPTLLIEVACRETGGAFRYHYSHELLNLKELVANYVMNSMEYVDEINTKNVAILSSATASLFLILLSLKRHGLKKGLSCRPIYWSIRQNCSDLGLQLELLDCYSRNNYLIPWNEFVQRIRSEKYDFVILTNPIYSVGLEIDSQYISALQQSCKDAGSLLIIDEAFHMPWFPTPRLPTYSQDMIVVRSPTKKLFANGLKIAHVVGPQEIINDIEKLSEPVIGGLHFGQVRFAEILYNAEDHKDIHSGIKTMFESNIQMLSAYYERIQEICRNFGGARLAKANSGSSTILELARLYNSDSIVEQLVFTAIRSRGISIIPSWRYSITRDGNPFGIRINLAQVGEVYVECVRQILELSNGFCQD